MNRTDLMIHDIAAILADLKTCQNRTAIFEKTLKSLCNFAISEHLAAPIREAQEDSARVAQILANSKK